MRRAAALICGCVVIAGCGASQATRTAPAPKRTATGGAIPPSLLAGVRPIGRGPRYQPPLAGAPSGRCTSTLGAREQAHVELFGANRVVLLAAGIGTRAPRRFEDGRLVHAACFGDLVTLDPTGTVYFRPGRALTLGDLFDAWGQTLTATRLASFGGGRVRIYVDGRERASASAPGAVRLTAGAEIVLEVGPRVPPHARFVFPAKPPASLR